MHSYGKWPDEYFDQVSDAAYEIGTFISRWGRIGVSQTKEKFGTVRVYCYFGFDSVHGLIWPRHCWIHEWWPYRLDLLMSSLLSKILNTIFLPYQRFIYRLAYKRAIKKYPHLRDEIFSCADFGEILEGVEGYKHNDYWEDTENA